MTLPRQISLILSDPRGQTPHSLGKVALSRLVPGSDAPLTPQSVTEGFTAWTGQPATVQRWEIDASGRLVLLVLECSAGMSGREAPALAPSRLPWEQPGWIIARKSELSQRIGPLACITQIRHGPLGAVLRIETDARETFWYKETLPLFAAETAALRWLNTRQPKRAPRLVAELAYGHLTADLPRTNASPSQPWWHDLNTIHIDSIGGTLPVPRLTPGMLSKRLSGLVPTETCALPDTQRLLRALDALDTLPGSEVLIHGDLHPENAIPTEQGWALVDWTDCALAHPLLDLALIPRYWPQDFVPALAHLATQWDLPQTPKGLPLHEVATAAGVARLLHQYALIHDATDPRYRHWAGHRITDWLGWLASRPL